MNRRFVPIAAALVFLFAVTLSGQDARVQMGKGESKDRKFKPGETIPFVVKLNPPPPNVEINSVTVNLYANEQSGLSGSYQASNAARPVEGSKVEFRVLVTLPAHAKSGMWRLGSLDLNFPGGSKSLKFNSLEFEVQPGKEIVLPDSATVEILKGRA